MADNNYTPQCVYCGQSMIADKTFASQEAADNYATSHCKCITAKEHQAEQATAEEREKKIADAKDAIDSFKIYCESKGHVLTDEIKGILLNCAVLSIDGEIDSMNLQFGRIKAKITINAKGATTILFSYSDSVKIEA